MQFLVIIFLLANAYVRCSVRNVLRGTMPKRDLLCLFQKIEVHHFLASRSFKMSCYNKTAVAYTK
jgi:hypothetical protein